MANEGCPPPYATGMGRRRAPSEELPMSSNSRSILPFLVLLVLAGLGVGIYLLSDSGERGGSGTPASRPSNGPEQPTEAPASATGIQGGSASRTTASQDPTAPSAHPLEDVPIVAAGRVDKPSGLELSGLEVVLHNAAGEQLSSADIGPDGRYELRYGRTLLAGWNVAATWATVKARAAATPEIDRWSPPVGGPLPHHPKGAAPVEVNLTIAPAPTLRGRVLDLSTGAPLHGAIVAACTNFAPWRDMPEETDTDESGNFELQFQDLPLGEVIVWVKADEHQATMVGPLTLLPGESRVIPFSLKAPVMAPGRVLDETSGKPISGAEVILLGKDFALSQERPTEITGPDGAFELDCSEMPLERARLRIRATGYAPAELVPTDLTQLGDIRLGKPVIVSGKLKPSGTEQIASMEVIVVAEEEWAWADPYFYDSVKLGSDGTFRLELENTPVGIAMLLLDSEPYAPLKLPIRSVQLKSSSETTREVEVGLTAEGPFPTFVIPAASRPGPGSMRPHPGK